jgi:BlaI family penicillinase repressor
MRRPAPQRDIPPPLELECLKVLWDLGEGTVREVRQALLESRGLAYTTVLTLLDRLAKRGTVTRRKQGRYFIYVPKLSREAMQQRAVKELVDGLFAGSREALRTHLRITGDGAPVQEVGMLPSEMKIVPASRRGG